MEIKILHLYPDVMNLYGEFANVEILKKYLLDLGHEVKVDILSLYDDKDIDSYDLYYMGCGTEKNQKVVLSEFLKYKDIVKEQFDNNKVMLFTGNSFELLGKSITDKYGKTFECLDIFPFETTESDKRITGDVLAKSKYIKETIVGFVNKSSSTTNINNPFATLLMGDGNNEDTKEEGISHNNLIGTHITGPILTKNPALLKYIVFLLNVDIKDDITYKYIEDGYKLTLSELEKRL